MIPTRKSTASGADRLSPEEMASIRNQDRMLPSQPVMCKLFQGDADAFARSLEALLLGPLACPSLENRWDLELKPGVTYASLGSDLVTLALLQLLVRLGRFRNILELGTYIGVSALFLAEAAGPDGRVTTVERGEEFFGIAKRNFQRNGVADRVQPILGGALEMLREFVTEGRTYDMVFLDAGKEDYADMLTPALGCLAPGGLLVVDDIFMNGDTLNLSPGTQKGRGVRRMLAAIEERSRRDGGLILPIGNGLLLLQGPSAPCPKSSMNPQNR